MNGLGLLLILLAAIGVIFLSAVIRYFEEMEDDDGDNK